MVCSDHSHWQVILLGRHVFRRQAWLEGCYVIHPRDQQDQILWEAEELLRHFVFRRGHDRFVIFARLFSFLCAPVALDGLDLVEGFCKHHSNVGSLGPAVFSLLYAVLYRQKWQHEIH